MQDVHALSLHSAFSHSPFRFMLAFGVVEEASAHTRLVPDDPPEFALVPGLKALCQGTKASLLAIEMVREESIFNL